MKGIRMKGYSLSGRSLFLTLFLSGFAAGVLYITLFGKAAAHETTLMSAYFFSKYQQVEFASEELFWYTLKARMSVFTILWLTGLTVLGTAAVCVFLFWIGAALGITVTTAAVKMGPAGILFCIGAGLPHFALYVPAGCWLLKRIGSMTAGRERTARAWADGRRALRLYALVWLAGAAVFFAGAFLESYVNPLFLKTVLKLR